MLIEIYDYNENLPKMGWFQRCFCCNEIVSDTIIYISEKYKTKYNFEVFLCRQCQKEIEEKEKYKMFAKKCEHYILNLNLQ